MADMAHTMVVISRTEDVLTFGVSNLVESRILAVECGTPIMKQSRTAYSPEGPLLYSEAITRADILQMTVREESQDYTI